jgi:cell wall-associated NlpC family hydrolase
MMQFGRRLNAFRPDLADKALEGVVEAERFVEGIPARIVVPKVPLRSKPDLETGIDTELLLGEDVIVLERAKGWAWIKSAFDAYVGYLPENALGEPLTATHWVTAPRTFLYPKPDMKTYPVETLSMASRLVASGEVETRGTKYLIFENGLSAIAAHFGTVDQPVETDYVSIAARLVETPYLWGGRTAFGLDCSGLVQLSMMMGGTGVLRDSDMQAETLGTEISRDRLKRGDLIFWKGHVAILEDAETIVHANGATMSVSRERLSGAMERIRPYYGEPTICRRP